MENSVSLTVSSISPTKKPIKLSTIFRPHLFNAVLGGFCLILTNIFLLSIPSLVNWSIQSIEGKNPPNFQLLYFDLSRWHIRELIALLALFAVLGGVFRVLSRIFLFNVGRDVERQVRYTIFSHLLLLSPHFFQKNSVGDLMSRLVSDLNNIRLLSGFAFLNILNAVLILFTTLPLLWGLDWQVTLWALLPFPLVLVFAQVLAKHMFKRTVANQKTIGKLSSRIQENLSGQEVIRAFNQEKNELKRFSELNDANFETSMALAKIRVVFFPLMSMMSALGIGIALYAGGNAVVEGRMNIGDMIEFNARLLQLAWPAIAMGFILSVYQRGQASLKRINEILKEQPTIFDGTMSDPQHQAGTVKAKNLYVKYPVDKDSKQNSDQDSKQTARQKKSTFALKNLSFELKTGEMLGVVGTNASGKSSLVRALTRWVSIDKNQLFIGGIDVNDWNLETFSKKISVVTDEVFLFSASLRDNICFGKPDSSDAELQQVLKIADLTRDVANFSEGLNTMVGERGVTLSGGQKQRVALARTLLMRPDLMILDDCLSAVDAETEHNIVSALRRGDFSGGKATTLIVISHRLSAVKTAEQILVLNDGELVEQGQHQTLLNQNGLYASLWGKEILTNEMKTALGASNES